jgi:TfoX/Sxy family transcriptional regulator of competence genes
MSYDAPGWEAMGYDEKTAERVRRMLSGRQDVVEKRMVGGLSFIVSGSMCCGLTSTALMVRVGPEARDRVLAQPHTRPLKLGRRSLAGFVCVEPPGYRTDAALAKWVQRGVDFVSALPAKKLAGRKPPPKAARR